MNDEFGDGGDDDQPTKEESKPKAPSNNTIVSTLEARLTMYKQAVQIAKTKGDAAKSRRYERQLKVAFYINDFFYHFDFFVDIFR